MSASWLLYAVFRDWVLPPASLFVLFALGFFIRKKFPRLSQTCCVGAVLALYAMSTDLGACLLGNPLEKLEAPLASTQHTGAQAIVVLTAGRVVQAPEYGKQDIPDYIALARMRYTSRLHKESMLPVLVSGGLGKPLGYSASLAEGMARGLNDDFSTPVKWMETESANTAENAAFSAKILLPAGVHKILLITDAMHMRRAKLAFQQQGLQVVPAPTMFLNTYDLRWTSLTPGVGNLRRSHYAIYEWLGLLWYRLQSPAHTAA